MNTHLVFVYGTLCEGYGNHHRIAEAEGSRLVGEATTAEARYVMRYSGFPIVSHAQPDETPTKIRGQVWEIGDDALAECDALEGHPTWYRRENVFVHVDGQPEPIIVETYIMPTELANRGYRPVIESGDWREYVSRHQANLQAEPYPG